MTTSVSNLTCGANDHTTDRPQDHRRAWLWWFLAVVVASQLYFVRELVAAFAMFAIAFVAIAFVVASLYMLTKAGEVALSRMAELRHPVLNVQVRAEQRKAA